MELLSDTLDQPKGMATDNETLMKKSRDSLRGKWGLAIGTFLVYMLIDGFAGAISPWASIISLLIGGPLALGAATFSLAIARGEEARFEQILDGFRRFGTALAAYLLMILYIVLWLLLFIIPGIIAALSYSMTFYIMHDDPAIKAEEALRKSKHMMYGYKMKLFYLFLWFLLLSLLCILTLGIGFLWLIPFVNVTIANFYDDIRDKSLR